MVYIALAFLVLAVLFFWQSNRQRKAAGLPAGRVIYTDTRGWGKLERPLFYQALGLTGKPDYLIQQNGQIIPVEISIYEDRSFDFVMKTPPAAALLRQAARVDKGSGEPNKQKVGTVTRAQVKEIAETKMPDLNAVDIEGAMKIIEGTARSMGITVEG